MFKYIVLLFLLIFSFIYSQDNISNQNTGSSNYFSIQENERAYSNNEPAILQDIRDIENRATTSTTGMFIRAIFGFLIILVGLYFVFIYLKSRYKKVSGSDNIIKVIATTPLATNRYISIIEILDDMYLVAISDHNINLLEKIENKETKDQIKMLYINSKDNIVDDSFKNMLNQTLSLFKQPKIKERNPLETTSEIRDKLKKLKSDDDN